VQFQFMYLRAEELARFILTFEGLYNRVIQAIRGVGSVYSLSPEDRLRVTRVEVDTFAKLTFRGSLTTRREGEGDADTGVLDLVREIFNEVNDREAERTGTQSLKAIPMAVAAEAPAAGLQESALAPVDGLRESILQVVAEKVPEARDDDASEIANRTFEILGEIFQRRNLWGLRLE